MERVVIEKKPVPSTSSTVSEGDDKDGDDKDGDDDDEDFTYRRASTAYEDDDEDVTIAVLPPVAPRQLVTLWR